MRVGWSAGHAERVTADSGYGRLLRAIERRGHEVVPVSEPGPDVDIVLLGAPATRMGPDRVKAWRRWVVRGGRLLVLGLAGGDGAELVSDGGMVPPGMELPGWTVTCDLTVPHPERPRLLRWSGCAFLPRGRARLDPPGTVTGARYWPRGRGWFRFGRTLDVFEVWPIPGEATVRTEDDVEARPAGWAWLHLGHGAGQLLGLADATTLTDGALADPDHAWLLSHVLGAWLPAPEAARCARLLDAEPAAVEAGGDTRRLLEVLDGPGLDVMGVDREILVERAPAMRALGEAGLCRAVDGRVRLTDAGRARMDVVIGVLESRERLAELDASDA